MKKIIFLSVLWICAYQLAYFQNDQSEKSKKYQETLIKEYSTRESSPLDSADFVKFSSLPFFPINMNFYVEAAFKRTPKEKKFKMKTSTERTPVYRKYGEIIFIIKGSEYKLNVYQNIELSKKKEFKKYLFLPFTDLTTGEETYGGGRYLDLEIPKTKTIFIDFNQAYNPYCAYNHGYSCPVPPPENFLNIRVEAGVKEGIIYKVNND